jgi:hypothetical protein
MPGPITSLSPEDFGSGKWDGGRATITDVVLKYHSGVAKKDNKPFTLIEAHVTWEKSEGGTVVPRYTIGNAQYACIRATADEDADEAEVGYAVSGREEGKPYTIDMTSDFGQLLASAVAQGFSARKLASGDVRALVGTEANVAGKPRKEGDKFPIMLITEIFKLPGGKSSAAAASKKKSTAAVDEDEPKSKSKTTSSDDLPSKSIQNRAAKMIKSTLAESDDDSVTIPEVIAANKKALKEDDDNKEIMSLFDNDDWIGSIEGLSYNEKKGTIRKAKD